MTAIDNKRRPPAIEFRRVSLSFDDKPALSDVSFALRSGAMICITGPSGSGKSVLVRLAIGLLPPDQGQVLVEGRDLGKLDEITLLQLRSSSMGVVFQDSSLFTGLSVYENAAYRLTEQGWPEEDTDRAALEILRFVGLEKDAEKLPEELSIGMGRRLEFARALVGWPRVMLFDEPTAGLDPLNARNILDLVIRARDIHDMSSLFVTKEPWEIRYLARYRAVEDEAHAVKIVPAAETGSDIEVIVLEAARIAFQGSIEAFASSELPAVTRITKGIEPRKGVKLL